MSSSSSSTSANKPVSFKRLMSLKRIGEDNFISQTLAWSPGGSSPRAFGGHVYAQAVYAASKTVSRGMVVHNVTGHFILQGRMDVPFRYRVRRIRNGGVYCLRSVDVYQDAPAELIVSRPIQKPSTVTANTPCFVATISFKHEESGSERWVPIRHQDVPIDHLRRTYRSVLEGIRPSDHPRAPASDALWWEDSNRASYTEATDRFPGLEIRKVDMTAFNGIAEQGGGGKAGEWRQLCFYRLLADDNEERNVKEINGALIEEPVKPQEPNVKEINGAVIEDPDEAQLDDLNLNACAHMYASDRNSLFLVQRALGYADRVTQMASLSHTVVFHGSPQQLRLRDRSGGPKWFVQEAWTSNSGENRGCHESRLWDWEDGTVVATTVQDGMVRVPPDFQGRGRAEKL